MWCGLETGRILVAAIKTIDLEGMERRREIISREARRREIERDQRQKGRVCLSLHLYVCVCVCEMDDKDILIKKFFCYRLENL